MNEKYEDENTREMINLACSLDPRFMMKYFSENKSYFLRHKITSEGKLIAKRIDESVPPAIDVATEEATPEAPPVKKKQKLVDILAKSCTSRSDSVESEERTQDELTQYLQMPSPDMKSNPLDWWKVHQTQFPILSTMAKNTYLYVLPVVHLKEFLVLVVMLLLHTVPVSNQTK